MLTFPTKFLAKTRVRRIGVGRRFQTSDGRANLTVNSIANHDNDFTGFVSRKHFALPSSAAVYKRITGSFFAVSGFYNQRIWYNLLQLCRRIHFTAFC